jgi:hypothetical protein
MVLRHPVYHEGVQGGSDYPYTIKIIENAKFLRFFEAQKELVPE